ncbi:hypothetical protein I6F20_32690 [Bradyrhizobium sp. IC3123]|uniref:hypothetical protein n=1 Tax=Bradyrhizobium sp. IC3123 TaxID=2793803 RepID=UPI001CD43D31|nr:hypothetical protein [Bradyrhizobium sp. IC3123]MCA1393777.1 hypothetical protein [Bradyrhizobium sp. IC3123]
MEEPENEQPQGFARARPIRVAFLISSHPHTQLIIDAIFAESVSRWGGRYSLICPCVDGYPQPAYLRWLKVFDPDIVYSFTDLADQSLYRLREELGPAYITRHREPSKNPPTAHDFRVELPIKVLSSLSTTLQYARAFPASAPQPLHIVDYLPGQPNDRFVDDNFGSLYGSHGMWPMPSNLADAFRPVALASAEVRANRMAANYNGETVSDPCSLLQFMAANRNTYGLSQLSADATPRIEVRSGSESAFTIVVGDTADDRIAFWNLRSRVAIHIGIGICSLIAPVSLLEQDAFFAALIELLKARNVVWRSSGPPLVELVSTSVSQERLGELQNRFIARDRWNAYRVGRAITLDSIVPSDEVLSYARQLVSGGFLENKPEWKEFSAAERQVKPPQVVPKHLNHIQVESFATTGSWAVDVSLERRESHSRYSNVRHNWHFPRRLPLHGAFLHSYESSHSGREWRWTRANAQGSLVLFAGLNEALPVITIPNDEIAFRRAMQRGNEWPPLHRLSAPITPTGPFAWSQPSDKGRYLMGALRMFGGLQNAGAILLHNYWRSVFEELGGAVGRARREQIKDAIKKKIRAVRTQPSNWDDATWERLTALVTREAYQVRVPQGALSYGELLKRHDPYLVKEEAILRDNKVEDPADWMNRARNSLRAAVQDRCAQRVLFQGYEWRCDTCFATNWNDISSLGPELSCSICGANEKAFVDKPWSFRLNGFLQDALREHGLLAVVWCLIELEKRARDTFFYLGPHNLWKEYPDNEQTRHDHEADLICILDGRVHLCEVKSSAREIALESLVEVARRLRPDVVTLAVMEEMSARLSAKAEELRVAIADPTIEVQLLSMTADDEWNDAYLP